MSKLVRIRQEKQVRNSLLYDDRRPFGPAMETAPEELERDLNNIRSQVNRIMRRNLVGNWHDNPPTSLQELKDSIADLVGREFHQPLSGAKNGLNTIFTTAATFRRDGKINESVYVNGVLMSEGVGNDYVASESVIGAGFDTITFAFAPITSDALTIDFAP